MLRLIQSAFCWGILLAAPAAHAAPDPVVHGSYAVCDPYSATSCLRPNSDGSSPTPTFTSAKLAAPRVTLVANTSTTFLAANAGRTSWHIQCDGTAAVAVSETGATISALTTPGVTTALAAVASSPGVGPLYTPDTISQTAITIFSTGTPQCWGIEGSR